MSLTNCKIGDSGEVEFESTKSSDGCDRDHYRDCIIAKSQRNLHQNPFTSGPAGRAEAPGRLAKTGKDDSQSSKGQS